MPKSSRNNRGGSRRSNNNNPEGRNQYNSGWMDLARERPATAAAVAAGAAAAGVFLWSKRGQISDQIAQLSDQIGEWTDNLTSSETRELETAGAETGFGGAAAAGKFSGTSAAGGINPGSTARSSAGKRRNASSPSQPGSVGGSVGGSGTMSGGSLETGPSGRGRT